MTRWIQLSALPLVLIAAGVLVGWAIALARKPRPVCRGPATGWDWMPWRMLLSRACGYDLTGLGVDGDSVRCPECGTVQPFLRRRKVRARRRIVLAGLLLMGAVLCWKVAWIRYGHWAKYTPTWVLAGLDYLPMPGRVEGAMLTRLEEGGVPRWERNLLASLAIHHLGGDKRSRNAFWACEVMVRLDREGLALLEAALSDPDFQRRQYAAELLREREQRYQWEEGPPEWTEPSQRLLEVSLEALKDDRFERYNAASSFAFLLAHRERVVPMLGGAIQSDDPQQAFMGAVLAGLLKAENLAPLAAPVLVAHFHNNSFMGDARVAAPAMVGLGDAGRPYLLRVINGSDAQARMLAWAVVKTIDHQPLGAAEHDAIRKVTERYRDLRVALEKPNDLWDWNSF